MLLRLYVGPAANPCLGDCRSIAKVEQPIRKDWGFAALVMLMALAFWGATGLLRVSHAMNHDFLAFYVGGLLARQGHQQDLYDTTLQMRAQRQIAPDSEALVPYIRPPVFAFVFAPLTLLPLKTAFAVWVAIQAAALVAAGWWVARRFGSDGLVYLAFFQPVAIAIFNGQDSAVLLLVVILAYELLSRGKPFAAGAVLGILLIKFHLLLLLPLALLSARRFRVLAGFTAAGAAYALSWVALAGAGGIRGYARILMRKDLENLEPGRFAMPNLVGMATNLNVSYPLVALLAGGVMIYAVWAVRRAPLWQWLGVTLTASMFVSPHAYPYDVVPLLPFALFAVFGPLRRSTKFAAATMVLPLPYLAAFLGPPVAIVMPLVILTVVIALALEVPAPGLVRAPAPS